MSTYHVRVHEALEALDADAARLGEATAARTDAAAKACRDVVGPLAEATTKLRRSLSITERTAADVADMRRRLETEAKDLGELLGGLGKAFSKLDQASRAVRQDPLLSHLHALEERTQRVAAALFPSAIDGLNDVNAALWQIRPVFSEYRRVRDGLAANPPAGASDTALEAAAAAAADIMRRFDDVDDLLDRLATEPLVGSGDDATTIIGKARDALTQAIRDAKGASGETVFKPFRDVLRDAERVADTVRDRLKKLRVPVFPTPDRLDAFAGCIDPELYANLAGVERFALMNIGARIRSITFGHGPEDHLASTRFQIRVFDVFPDRVYFTASSDLLDTVAALAKDAPGRRPMFVDAPAGLHKFNKGSFKQVKGDKGNLQFSYLPGTDENPEDTTRVRFDADIDLYRGTVAHLFGEVLVNHLTGSKTNQFKVFDVLAENGVEPLGGFSVVTV